MLSMRMIIVGLLMFQNTFSQSDVPAGKYFPPLDIPLILSGNFGELRPDHFHSGVDFKTQGVTGKKVYAVEEGYVSRIKIQTMGYGKSIYITHPNGITSVYGHLEQYNDTLSKYVKAYQYQKKTHTLDLYPEKNSFRIKKGEIIAYSGNTGSSGGPHLHFELRGTSSQHPLNVLKYGFDVKDNIPPQLYNLYIYPLEETSEGRYPQPKVFDLQKNNGMYHVTAGDTILLKGKVGFGLETSDFLNDANNQCGIYSIEVYLNDEAVYLFRMDEFSFDESSYINAHADYRALLEKGKKVHLLYRKPNNHLSLYPHLLNNGLMGLNAGEKAKIDINVKDAFGNISTLSFFAKGSSPAYKDIKPDSLSGQLFRWNTANYYESTQIRIVVPLNSLYEDYLFNYSRSNSGYQKIYPFTHFIGTPLTPLHAPAVLTISGEIIPDGIRNKTTIARLENQDKIVCLSSKWAGNKISASISKFGNYTLVVDSVAPSLIPVNLKPGSDMSTMASVKFRLTDDLSGVANYQGFIDGSWVLFEYDPKNELIEYIFDKQRMISGEEHILELHAKDAMGNEKIYNAKFIW